VVTVLFCDLAGFTARSDGADPEDVRALLRPYHARLRYEIERHGGMLDKFIGDGVMAVFGAPVAHEDDPERAVRTALAILAAVDELNERHPTLDLKVRIGITTGEAVVALDHRGDSERVVGDVVNTASRLEGVAPVGGIVVGEPTFQSTSRLFDYQSLPPVQVKGKAHPLPIWRAHAARSRPGIDVVDQAPTVDLVGREVELTLLTSVYERALREGSVQLVTIVGEPGVGKTRLIRELRGIVEARPELVAWRQGRCVAYGEETSFWALGEVVKAQAGVLASDNTAEAASKLGDAVAGLVEDQAEQEWLMSRLTPLAGLTELDGLLSQPPEQEETFAAWRRFLEAIAAQRPLVMVLEDLHWADPALLAFTMHLVEWAAPVPMLVVCTARPELYGTAPGWGGGLHNATTIALRPLSDVDTARLVAALLEQVVLPATLQARLLERAGGNPLYAEEVCRMLAERGGLERDGRTLKLPSDVELALPNSLGALIAARLDTVVPEHRALLEDAAVVGTVFWAGALVAMGARDPAHVRVGLHELVRRDFIRRARSSSVGGDVEYAFWHVLTREAAYARLPRAARARKHAAAAAWIEQTAGERVADQAEVLAHHYETALQLALAADATEQLATYQDSARHFLVLAGDRMMALDATRADAYYRRALRLVPRGHPEQAQVLAKAAQAAHHAGRLADAGRAFEEAIGSFRAGGYLLDAGTVEILRSDLLWFSGEPARSRDACATAIALLEREPPSVALAIAYAEMVAKLVFLGRPTAAVEWAGKAIALARQVGADEAHQWALQQRGLARCDLGDWDGIDDLRQAVELGLQLGLGRRSAMAYSNLADRIRLTEGPAVALQTFQTGLDLCRQRGIMDIGTFCQADLLQCLFDLGDWDELVATADEVIAWSGAQGGSYAVVLAESRKARVLAWRGEVAPASTLINEALPRAREIADPQMLGCALPVAALIEQRQGNHLAAVRLVEELDQGINQSPATYRAPALPDLVRVCMAAGELILVRRLLDGLEVRAAGLRHCLTTAHALLAEAQGDLEPAADLHTQAATGWSNYGNLPEHGQALLGLGRCLARLQHPQARDRLRQARAIFARLGARPLVAESDSWLQRSLPPAADATG
jgi:class 3 adenylate cyclase/tetratricopeptide (TPR) repeat protein/energy-coupling factor transporter ATP-binding protein EcfA2